MVNEQTKKECEITRKRTFNIVLMSYFCSVWNSFFSFYPKWFLFLCVALFCCSNRLFDGAFPCACMKTRVTFYKDAQQLTTSIRCIDSLDENTNNTRLYIRYRIFWCVVWLPPQTLCMYVTIGSHSNNRTTFAVVCDTKHCIYTKRSM